MKLKEIFTVKTFDDTDTPYIPERFEKEIILHIFKNYYANIDHSFKTPLILAISGAPGMGKTFQTEAVLDKLGVEKYTISGAEFENEHAGVPVKNLRNLYKTISDDIYFKSIKMGAIVIDDIDAALGQWNGLVQYTMNRQLLIKTLIDFADSPYQISAYDDGECMQKYATSRVPLIVTLNDETKMYEPLMRNGRTTVFPWIPKPEEISYVLDRLFRGSFDEKSPFHLYRELLSYAQETLEWEISSLPISLFSDVRASIYDEYIWKQISSLKSFDAFSTIASDLTNKRNLTQSYQYAVLYEIGKKLLHENKNYLSFNQI